MVAKPYIPYPKPNPGCVYFEQEAYDTLRVIWDGFLPITRNRAIASIGHFNGNFAYNSLKSLPMEYAPVDVWNARNAAAQQGFKP